MGALLRGRPGLRLGGFGRQVLRLLLCRQIRGLGKEARGRRSPHSGHGCSSGGRSRRDLLRGWRPGHLNLLGRRLVVVPGKHISWTVQLCGSDLRGGSQDYASVGCITPGRVCRGSR